MRVEHIALWCLDIEKMASFYEMYFNATRSNKYYNDKTGFSSYFMSFSTGARIELMSKTSDVGEYYNPEAVSLGLAHLAVSVGSVDSVDSLTARLEIDGYIVRGKPRKTGDGYYESVILDPENNIIEITV